MSLSVLFLYIVLFYIEVKQAETEDQLEKAVDKCDSWRTQIEGLPNPVTMDNKYAFVKNAILFHVLIQWKSCYDQLAEGLQYYEVCLC